MTFVGLLGMATPVSAQTYTWTGLATPDPNWSTAGNWDTAPLSDTTNTLIVLTGGLNTNTVVDTNFGINSLTFNATAGTFTVGGANTLSIGSGGINLITGNANSQLVSTNLALVAGQTWTNNSTGLLTVSGSIANGTNLLTVTGSGNTTISGAIGGGSGGLTKTGAGLLLLSGANTYTGLTSITGGIVRASVNNTFAAGAYSLANTANVALELNNTTQTIGSLTGGGTAGGGVALGSGTLTVGGLNTSTTYTGLFSGTGTINKVGTGTLTLRGNGTWTGPMSITGGGSISIDTSTRLTTAGTGTVTLNNGTLQNTNAGNGGSFISATRGIAIGTLGGTIDYTTAIPTNSSIYAGTITGTGTLTKIGFGEFRYQGAGLPNTTFTRLVVNEGLFRLGFAASTSDERGFGAVPGAFTADAITLNGGAIGSSLNPITLHANRGITLGANGGTFIMSSSSITVPGVITGSGSLLTNATSGALTLNALNTYTGSTTMTGTLAGGGNFSVSNLDNGGLPSGIGQSSNAATNLVLNGGTFSYTGSATSTDRLFSITSTGATLNASGTGPVTFSNTGAILATDKAATSFTLTSTLTTANVINGNYNDMIGVTVGMPVSGTNIPIGTTVASINATGNQFTLSAAATGTGNSVVTFTSLNRTLTLTGANTGDNTLAGALSNSPSTTLGVTKDGLGTWIMSGTSSYSGLTRINAGVLGFTTIANVGAGNSSLGAPTTVANGTINIGATTVGATLRYLGTVSASTDRVINLGGTTGGATLDASGTGSGTITYTSNLTATGVGVKTLTLTGTSGGINTVGGVIPDSSGGATSVTKAGNGTWNLTGANTYTGATTVNAGILFVNNVSGSGTGTGAVTVNANAILGGTGTIGGAVTVASGGFLAPGNSIGTLTVNNTVTLAAGSTYVVELNASGSQADLIRSTGITVTGAIPSISLTGTLAGTEEFLIAQNVSGTTAVTGTFAGLPNGSVVGNFSGTDLYVYYDSRLSGTTIVAENGSIIFTPVPVPEPTTILAIGALAFGIFRRLRRRETASPALAA